MCPRSLEGTLIPRVPTTHFDQVDVPKKVMNLLYHQNGPNLKSPNFFSAKMVQTRKTVRLRRTSRDAPLAFGASLGIGSGLGARFGRHRSKQIAWVEPTNPSLGGESGKPLLKEVFLCLFFFFVGLFVV